MIPQDHNMPDEARLQMGQPDIPSPGPVQSGMKQTYAQNNLQLYSQLLHYGYSHQDFQALTQAYHTTTTLFTCMYRPSFKCFLSHLVGVASILIALRAPIDLIIAGLLHASYSRGNFGGTHVGMATFKRDQLKQDVGPESEAYIARYTTLPWTPSSIASFRKTTGQLSHLDRHVIIIRLANELEDHLDLGIWYGPHPQTRIGRIHRIGTLLIDLAIQLNLPFLGEELKRVFNECLAGHTSLNLHGSTSSRNSFSLIPSSCRRSFKGRVLTYLRQHRHSSQGDPCESTIHKGSAWNPGDRVHSNTSCLSVWDSFPSFAQTNIQLYNQMNRMGYSETEQMSICHAYETAMRLFAGRFHIHYKTHIVHVVRVASILTALQVPVEVIAAGLIHNVYKNGDFGTGMRGFSTKKQEYLFQSVGPDVEQYVAGFTFLKWNDATLPGVLEELMVEQRSKHYVVLLRLADLLEHNLDYGVLYLKPGHQKRYFSPGTNSLILQIAERLGYPFLVQELQRAFTHNMTNIHKISGLTLRIQNQSSVVLPKNFTNRTVITFIQAIQCTWPRLARRVEVFLPPVNTKAG